MTEYVVIPVKTGIQICFILSVAKYLVLKNIKDHWFWLIVSFLGGIIGALIVNWLLKINR